jgi:LPS sulfotransferase NodH
MMESKFRYFVLLADMRTGSNLFESTISLYDDIACYGELFNPHFIGGPKKPSLTTIDIAERDADPVAVIENIIGQNPFKLTGFRLFSDHSLKVLNHVLADPTCAKIILRRNPLDSFISHQIASKTGQWQLRDLAVRRATKIQFQIDKFQLYLERKIANYEKLNRALQQSGQTAFHIAYEDMARIETFNGVAKFLGADQKLTTFATAIKRQNPADLREKVINYDEMRTQLVDLNHFESDSDPYVEPSKTQGSVAVHAGRTIPLMYFPLTYDGNDQILHWMKELEQDNLPPKTKMKGREIRDWLSENTDRVVFTCVEHPIERAYRAFNNRIAFISPEKNKWIRRVLVEQYNLELPNWPEGRAPNSGDLNEANYSTAQHGENFIKFLKFIHGNLRGQTRAPIDPHWGSQHIAIAGYERWTIPNLVIHPDRRDTLLTFIQRQLGIDPAKIIEPAQQTDLIVLADVYNAKIEAGARKAYAEDYLRLGFQNWKPTD